jgi:hypothetical protein
MDNKFVLIVSDQEEDKHGEITLLETVQEVERLIETLLEAGHERERMRVFCGAEAEFETTYRPVVSLTDGEVETPTRPDREDAPARPQVIEAGTRAEPVPVQAHGDNGGSGSPVRFSSLFRSASDDASAIHMTACEEVG